MVWSGGFWGVVLSGGFLGVWFLIGGFLGRGFLDVEINGVVVFDFYCFSYCFKGSDGLGVVEVVVSFLGFGCGEFWFSKMVNLWVI